MGIVCINGHASEEPDPRPGELPYYHFSEGVYETLRTVRGWLYNWLEHRSRLEASARGKGFEIPPRLMDDIGMNAQTMVARNREQWGGAKEAKVRIQVAPDCDYYIQVVPLAARGEVMHRQGIEAVTVLRERPTPHIKSINPEFTRWAAALKREKNVGEVLLMNQKGHVTEGSITNLFMVDRKGVLVTPGDEVLEGTTRARILDLVPFKGKVEFRALTPQDLYDARELFVCNVSSEAIPVVSVDGHRIGTGIPGVVTERVARLLRTERLKESYYDFPDSIG